MVSNTVQVTIFELWLAKNASINQISAVSSEQKSEIKCWKVKFSANKWI